MSHDLRIAIGQARNEKKLSQEQLAQLICEPKANISAYESGKSVPSGKSIASMEKALGVKLPRPEKKKISNEWGILIRLLDNLKLTLGWAS